MDAATMTFEKAIDVQPLIRWHARRPDRTSVIRAAQVAFRNAVLDGVLMNVSPQGALVHLFEEAELPDIATLSLSGGETWTVRRRWQHGAHVGFEIVGTAGSSARL